MDQERRDADELIEQVEREAALGERLRLRIAPSASTRTSHFSIGMGYTRTTLCA